MKSFYVLSALLFLLVFTSAVLAQTQLKGEISGTVVDEEGERIPGATITLTGEKLFQKFLSRVSTSNGNFRFLNLNPGNYSLEVSLEGFTTIKIPKIVVGMGRSVPIRAVMKPSQLEEEVEVIATAPLIEAKTPQRSTNFDNFQIENMPNPRHFIDIVNSAPGVYDNTAYGSGGNVSWGGGGIYQARGSMTSAFRLNGVDVSNTAAGYTTVNPIYETIEEVQVIGIGASAEYGNFVGATVNVVTKSGTNDFHGSITGIYSDSKTFYADNAGNYEDYIYTRYWKHDAEGTVFFSGPIIREKFFFALSAGYVSKKVRYSYSDVYQDMNRPLVYGKLDYQVDNRNTLTFMINMNPSKYTNNGIYSSNYADSVAYDQDTTSNAFFGSWNSILSENTFTYLKGAYHKDKIEWLPYTLGVPQYTDASTYSVMGGSSMKRRVYSRRAEINTALTHYTDEFLEMAHELKIGLEYENANAGEWREYVGGGNLRSTPMGAITLWTVTAGGNQDALGTIRGFRAYVQDNIRVNNSLRLNLGLRFENPNMDAKNIAGSVEIAKWSFLSPRIGFTYDLSGGAAESILRGSFGIYYNRPLVQTYQYNCFPGNDDQLTYQLFLPNENFNPTNENIQARFNEVTKPENLIRTYKYSDPVPVDPNIKLNRTSTYNAGFSQQLTPKFALEIDYIYKKDFNRFHIESANAEKHVYSPREWTDPWIGNTITLWDQVDRFPDDELMFTNSSWYKKQTHMAIFQLKKMPTDNWSMIASYTYQNTKSNLSGTGSNDIFGFPDYNVDTDPYYYDNPLQWGRQWMRKHQIKLLTTYFGPWGINMSVDVKGMSGFPWHGELYSFYMPAGEGMFRTIGNPLVLLNERGKFDGQFSWMVDLRFAKAFKIAGSHLEFRFDIFNLLNADYYYHTEARPYATFSNGDSSYGKPRSLLPPRNARLGLTWRF